MGVRHFSPICHNTPWPCKPLWKLNSQGRRIWCYNNVSSPQKHQGVDVTNTLMHTLTSAHVCACFSQLLNEDGYLEVSVALIPLFLDGGLQGGWAWTSITLVRFKNSVMKRGEDGRLAEDGFQIEEIPQRAVHYISVFLLSALTGCLTTSTLLLLLTHSCACTARSALLRIGSFVFVTVATEQQEWHAEF